MYFFRKKCKTYFEIRDDLYYLRNTKVNAIIFVKEKEKLNYKKYFKNYFLYLNDTSILVKVSILT